MEKSDEDLEREWNEFFGWHEKTTKKALEEIKDGIASMKNNQISTQEEK